MAFWFFFLLALGLILLVIARWGRKQSGLPSGDVVYSDTCTLGRIDAPLFSPNYQLTGKPDYLISQDENIIPVEVKSGPAPPQPYRSHVLQLAAYCLLIDECYQKIPPYGIIRYDNHAFTIPYTEDLEQDLLVVLEDMRADLDNDDAPRNHNDPRRCHGCGYREACDERLV